MMTMTTTNITMYLIGSDALSKFVINYLLQITNRKTFIFYIKQEDERKVKCWLKQGTITVGYMMNVSQYALLWSNHTKLKTIAYFFKHQQGLSPMTYPYLIHDSSNMINS